MLPFTWLAEAEQRVASHLATTPVTYDTDLDLYFKWENQQVTGSFKARGALNKVLTLQDWERARGLVTASAGNHGQGLARAAQQVGARVIIFASEHAVPAKLAAMRALGAEVRLVAGGYAEAEAAGLAYARENEATWVSAYNDGQIIAGQGTVALEVLRQLPPLEALTWIVPVGGGGLISGIATAVRSAEYRVRSEHRVVGVQPEQSPFFYTLFRSGSQAGAEDRPTLADGLAGAVEDGSLTIPLVQRWVDEMVLVNEREIRQAIRYVWEKHGQRIEGSAAVGPAAALAGKITHRPALTVISGGNIDPATHAEIVRTG